MYSSAFSREGLPVIDRRDAGISRREREMYDMIHEELLDAIGIEEREFPAVLESLKAGIWLAGFSVS